MCLITLSVCCWIQSFASVLFAWIHNFRYNSILLAKFCVLKYAHNLLLLRCSLKNVLIISHLPHSIRFNWWFFALMCYFAVFLFCFVLFCCVCAQWNDRDRTRVVDFGETFFLRSSGKTRYQHNLWDWHSDTSVNYHSIQMCVTKRLILNVIAKKNSNSLIKRIKWNLFYVTVALVEAACFRT